MPTIVPHLKPEEVLERYHKAREAIEALRWLAVYHALQGATAKEIARTLDRSLRWVHLVLARYNREGPGALTDRRHHNPGRKPKLSPEESQALLQVLEGPPPDGGLWTGPKLRAWVREHFQKELSLSPIYRFLTQEAFKKPQPRGRGGQEAGEEGPGLGLRRTPLRAKGGGA